MQKEQLSLGIIGVSDGNGHPFSWSSIFNGYNVPRMEECGYPLIPRYLEKERWPSATLSSAKVNYVWTQDLSMSKKIAETALIPEIVGAPEDMLGKVDAILLARDDAKNHLKNAKVFLENKVPIYIDKPIATSCASLEKLWNTQTSDYQVFSCSALSFADELQLDLVDKQKIGKIISITAWSPKCWEKYAIHLIEPIIDYFGNEDAIISHTAMHHNDGGTRLELTYENCPSIVVETLGTKSGSGLGIRYTGENGTVEKVPTDMFKAFKNSLALFVTNVRNPHRSFATSYEHHRKVVKIIELGT